MRLITLKSTNYYYPEQDDVQWASEATEFAVALAGAINLISPSTDVEDTLVSGLVEDGLLRSIPFLSFDSTKLLASDVTLMVYRSGGSIAENSLNSISVMWNLNTNQWDYSMSGSGNCDVEFDLITTGTVGQLKYRADSIGSTVFKMRFRSLSMPA